MGLLFLHDGVACHRARLDYIAQICYNTLNIPILPTEVTKMKHKWVAPVFAAVFIAAVILGLVIRFQNVKDPADEIRATLPTEDVTLPVTEPNVPAYTVPTDPPETTPPSETEPEPKDEASEPETPDLFETPPELEDQTVDTSENDGDGIVRICIGGDTSIDSEFADFARSRSVDYPWAEISEVMNAADIAIVNLETCVSERGTSEKREGYGFRTPPEMLEGFKNAGIDAVNLANNHTRDFGYDALTDTFAHLKNYGIGYFGAGQDYDDASGLLIIERDGVKIGFTGANRVYLTPDCAAKEEHAGINQIGDPDSESTKAYIDRLYEYDTQCDVLIVFLHAGTEEVFDVTSYQKEMSRKFIDAGADIVVGGHSHTLQPIEFYEGKPIIYSIGNLIFWHIDDDIDGLTAIFDIEVDKNGFRGLKLHPLFIKNYKVYYLEDGAGSFPMRYSQIIELMNGICKPYGTQFDSGGVMYTIAE